MLAGSHGPALQAPRAAWTGPADQGTSVLRSTRLNFAKRRLRGLGGEGFDSPVRQTRGAACRGRRAGPPRAAPGRRPGLGPQRAAPRMTMCGGLGSWRDRRPLAASGPSGPCGAGCAARVAAAPAASAAPAPSGIPQHPHGVHDGNAPQGLGNLQSPNRWPESKGGG